MIVPLANYSTSRDYRRLWELAHDHSIVCVVDCLPGVPETCRGIAWTIYSKEWNPEVMQVNAIGIYPVWAESIEQFIAQCERCNLEWLQPLPNPEVTQ